MADKGEKIITHISNFRPVKRIEDVINIFYNIQKEIPAKLMMVGDGPKKNLLNSYAKNWALMKKSSFLVRVMR